MEPSAFTDARDYTLDALINMLQGKADDARKRAETEKKGGDGITSYALYGEAEMYQSFADFLADEERAINTYIEKYMAGLN